MRHENEIINGDFDNVVICAGVNTQNFANRLGDKLTYTMLREHNLEQLKETKKVVTLCPHCAVNLNKEYKKYNPPIH